MEQKFLELTPKRYICPYCGKWHEWSKSRRLGYYDSSWYKAEFSCDECPGHSSKYSIFFSEDYLYYSTDSICNRANQVLKGKVHISSIKESYELPRVTFDVDFLAADEVGSYPCGNCDFKPKCNICRLGQQGDGRHMKITFGFEFEPSEYMRLARKRENALKGKEQSLQERESALRTRELEQQRQAEQSTQQKNKEDTTMALFNMNMEFGQNKDQNIASTLLGVAVKNGNTWRIYDRKKKEITDVGDLQLGNLPVFVLPSTKLNEGDLIKDAGEYYFVMKVAKESTQTLCAKTGEMKTVIPIKNVLGFSCYSKVIALSDSINMGDDFDVEKLAIMSAMCGQSCEDGGQMNQLLPLMLFKDKLGGDEDMMKMMLMSSMMAAPAEGDDQNTGMNQLLPLMLLKDKNGGDDDMMKMVLMSSMMGGNMAGNNNPVISYLMLDMLMCKKKDEQPPQQSGN